MNVSRSSSGLENYVKCVLHRWSTALALALALAGGLHNPCSDSQWGEGIISIQDGIRIESSWTSASGSSCPIQIQLRTHTHTHGGGASGSGIWGAIIESHSKWQATQGAHCVFFSFFLSPYSQGFTYVAPSILEDMHRANRMPARSPRRTPRQLPDSSFRLQFPSANVGANAPLAMHGHSQRSGMFARATPPHHMQTFAPRPSPAQDEMMDVQGLPMV